jgi:hypothetical protein
MTPAPLTRVAERGVEGQRQGDALFAALAAAGAIEGDLFSETLKVVGFALSASRRGR